MKDPIYPIYAENNGVYKTYIRKEENGIWYKMLVQCSDDLPFFISACYNFILFGCVNIDIKNPDGTAVAIKDEDQRSEEERLFPDFFKPYKA